MTGVYTNMFLCMYVYACKCVSMLASCATPDHTSNYATCSVTSQHTHSRWTERACEPSRAHSAARWPNTSPSSSWKQSPTSNVSIWPPAHQCSDSCCSHSCTQQHRTQTACNIELLVGASSIGTRWSSESFSQKQDVFWRRTVSTRHSRRASCASQRFPLLQRKQP